MDADDITFIIGILLVLAMPWLLGLAWALQKAMRLFHGFCQDVLPAQQSKETGNATTMPAELTKSNQSNKKMMKIQLFIATIAIIIAILLNEAYSNIRWIDRILLDCSEELDEGSFYQGKCNIDGQRQGYGVHRDKNGNSYVGEFINGEKHGEGTEILKDGSFYHGELKEGKQHGRGFYRDGNGNVYKGYFDNGEKHGMGSYKYANGDSYEGTFRRGKKHGLEGIYRYKNRAAIYVGGFEDDEMHDDYGAYIQEDGFFYLGKWNHGKLVAAFCRKTRSSLCQPSELPDSLGMEGQCTVVPPSQKSYVAPCFLYSH